MSALSFVSLKAYGDFVIARSALQNALAPQGLGLGIVLGEHLFKLDQVLGVSPSRHILRHKEASVPAAFDLKKHGTIAGLQSLIRIRSGLRELQLQPETKLIFDKIGPREVYIARGFSSQALPVSSENIYLAYRALLEDHGIKSRDMVRNLPRAGGKVGIFPGSRIAHKNIPIDVVSAVISRCQESDLECAVFLLEGERPDLENIIPGSYVLHRDFSALVQAVRSSSRVISADSLPAHLAEFLGVSVFVLSPAANPYWLPYSCLSGDLWGLFPDSKDRKGSLAGYLRRGVIRQEVSR